MFVKILFWDLDYSWTPLIRSPMGKGKWFELTGVRINEVKLSSKGNEYYFELAGTSN